MDKIKLLFVEDDSSYAFMVKESLELEGNYQVCTAANGEEGLKAYLSFAPDVIVSDIEMPKMKGTEMVMRIRKNDKEIPILIATSYNNAQAVLDGYALGIDNFIKKPFLPRELDAHIGAILKRLKIVSGCDNTTKLISIGDYVFNLETRDLQCQDIHYTLTPRETRILCRLYDHKDELVKRSDLLDEFWGYEDFFTSRSLDVFISSLRKYLAHDANIKIQTIRREGFKLIVGDSHR